MWIYGKGEKCGFWWVIGCRISSFHQKFAQKLLFFSLKALEVPLFPQMRAYHGLWNSSERRYDSSELSFQCSWLEGVGKKERQKEAFPHYPTSQQPEKRVCSNYICVRSTLIDHGIWNAFEVGSYWDVLCTLGKESGNWGSKLMIVYVWGTLTSQGVAR